LAGKGVDPRRAIFFLGKLLLAQRFVQRLKLALQGQQCEAKRAR
jgi:hypothetical protein